MSTRSFRACLPVRDRPVQSTLRFLARHLRQRRREIGSRWRRLPAGRQALLALAHLRGSDTYGQLAAAFKVGIATVYRYIREAVDVLATLAPTLEQAVSTAATKAFVILDGILLPIDRIAADRPLCSGKHGKHGMNVQAITDPFGRLLWASPALPGTVHDIKAARAHGIPAALAKLASVAGRTRRTKDQAAPSASLPRSLGQTLHRSASRQCLPREDPRARRAGDGHPQDLAAPAQTPLQYDPHHHHRQGHPRPATRSALTRPGSTTQKGPQHRA